MAKKQTPTQHPTLVLPTTVHLSQVTNIHSGDALWVLRGEDEEQIYGTLVEVKNVYIKNIDPIYQEVSWPAQTVGFDIWGVEYDFTLEAMPPTKSEYKKIRRTIDDVEICSCTYKINTPL